MTSFQILPMISSANMVNSRPSAQQLALFAGLHAQLWVVSPYIQLSGSSTQPCSAIWRTRLTLLVLVWLSQLLAFCLSPTLLECQAALKHSYHKLLVPEITSCARSTSIGSMSSTLSCFWFWWFLPYLCKISFITRYNNAKSSASSLSKPIGSFRLASTSNCKPRRPFSTRSPWENPQSFSFLSVWQLWSSYRSSLSAPWYMTVVSSLSVFARLCSCWCAL